MGWVKRLADHVTQDLMGHDDLEFAWIDPRHADPLRDGLHGKYRAQ